MIQLDKACSFKRLRKIFNLFLKLTGNPCNVQIRRQTTDISFPGDKNGLEPSNNSSLNHIVTCKMLLNHIARVLETDIEPNDHTMLPIDSKEELQISSESEDQD